jgi:hypothetical protein
VPGLDLNPERRGQTSERRGRNAGPGRPGWLTTQVYPAPGPRGLTPRSAGVASEQREALRHFVASEPELYAKARAAIYDEYRRSYSTLKQAWSMGARLFGGATEDVRKVLPEIVNGNELDPTFRTSGRGFLVISRPRLALAFDQTREVFLRCPGP